jgi:hypothetical protein
MDSDKDWLLFAVYADQGSADVLQTRLELEKVPVRVEARHLENAPEYRLFVHRSLAHRARWVVAQLPPTEAELFFLATGKLPGEEKK